MIASWMLYAMAVSALVTGAAYAAEWALAAQRRPRRIAWTAGLLLSALWPLSSIVLRLLPAPTRPVSMLPFTIVVQAPSAITADEAAAIARAAFVNRALMLVWVTLSALLLLRLGRGIIALRASRAAWKRGRVNGVRVQVSENVGPAVVGLRSMDVVVPEWILSLDEPLRAIVLRHEEEHRQARDPYLLFGASLLVALMPWNVALWIQARRLRLAIEMDCDARVLQAHPSPERYGLLILTIAQRRSTSPALFAPMLSEPRTNLERRIRAMKNTKRVARASAFAGALAAVAMLAFASSLQSASTSFGKPHVAPALLRVADRVMPVVLPETIPLKKATALPTGPAKQEVRKLEAVRVVAGSDAQGTNPAPRYPVMLRAAEVEGAVVAQFAYDASGAIDKTSIRIVSSTHDLFTAAVKAALASWHGSPNTSVQTPFIFVLTNKSAKDLANYPGGMPAGAMVIKAPPVAPGEQLSPAEAPTPVSGSQTFFEFQIEKPATVLPNNPGPRYPDALREAKIEGEVLAQFVVDNDGQPIVETLKVLKSTDPLFTEAVRNALPNIRYSPAMVDGRAVKQLVQMPFHFNLSKEP